MDTLNWNNNLNIQQAKQFFDNYVSAWNPRSLPERQNRSHHTQNDDPCILNTQQILSLDPLYDYEEILNTVQRNTECTKHTYLRK